MGVRVNMSADTELAFQFIAFVVKFCIGFLLDNPFLVLLFLLAGLLLLISIKYLKNHFKGPPAVLTSQWTSLTCIFIILSMSIKMHYFNSQSLEFKREMVNAHWMLKQGAEHRIDLLRQIDQSGLTREVTNNTEANEKTNPLDGCLHVFLDLGSNRGLQIRKLYEPHLFPLAPILPLYTKYFGEPEDRKNQEICSVAFEPNPKHAEHLQGLAESYSTCGIKVLVFNNTGVGHRDTTSSFAPFNTLLGHEVGQDASARLIHDDESVEAFMETHFHEGVQVETVQVVRFAKFITDVVAKRKLPTSAGVTTPRVVIKADIEGAELKIIPDMVVTGALGHVDNLHMEWHGNASYRQGREAAMISKLAPAITALSELTISEGIEHQFTIEEMDDETYTGLLIYKPWGDYSELPVPTC